MRKNTKIACIWAAIVLLAALSVPGCGMAGSYGSNTSSAGDSEADHETEWTTVAQLIGTQKDDVSEVFDLAGGNVRITYDINTITRDKIIDSGTSLIYILPEGNSKTMNMDGIMEIAVQDITTVGSRQNEQITVEKPAGSYYIEINTSSVESYSIRVEER
jgi:hypothetical protein